MRIGDLSSDVCSSDLIDAVGTPTQPIIFTGRGNVVGSATDNTSQLWGGIVLLGRAPITDCLAPGAAEGTAACERDTEGTSNALYGGATPTDNSGRLSYVQIRYSGRSEEHTSELQSLMRISYAVFCLKKKKQNTDHTNSKI